MSKGVIVLPLKPRTTDQIRRVCSPGDLEGKRHAMNSEASLVYDNRLFHKMLCSVESRPEPGLLRRDPEMSEDHTVFRGIERRPPVREMSFSEIPRYDAARLAGPTRRAGHDAGGAMDGENGRRRCRVSRYRPPAW